MATDFFSSTCVKRHEAGRNWAPHVAQVAVVNNKEVIYKPGAAAALCLDRIVVSNGGLNSG